MKLRLKKFDRCDQRHIKSNACPAEERGDIAEAERLYRVLMKTDPTGASAPFNLGNMLRGRWSLRRSGSRFAGCDPRQSSRSRSLV
jgi:hypothetical protein